jgi:hypothetical protein
MVAVNRNGVRQKPMPMIPAFCTRCDAIFASGIFAANGINFTFVGNTAGPCPKCGGMGRIPDGVYNFIDQTIHLVSGPATTIRDLQRLVQLLENARAQKDSGEEIARKIEKEVPQLASVRDLLPKTRTELYAFITLFLVIVGWWITIGSRDGLSKFELEALRGMLLERAMSAHAPTNKPTVQPPAIPHQKPNSGHKKVGRNQRCPCGSGLKYKRCHGR